MSIDGTSHLEKGKPCQDAHVCRTLPGGFVFAAVADGVGSAAHSEITSRMACDVLAESCEALVAPEFYVPLIRYFLDGTAYGVTAENIREFEESRRQFLTGESCRAITDDKTVLAGMNTDAPPAAKDASYYAEPDWAALQEAWNRRAYPHLTDGAQVYRCCVGMPEYLPREIQEKMRVGLENAPLPTFTEATDNFALAVHIFQLLMNGVHPFACSVIPSADSVVTPDTSDSILNGECPFFTPVAGRDIPRFAPPLDILPDEIRELFRPAFVAGHADPAKRPGAETWYYALERLDGNLTQCPTVIFHEYSSALSACPWCAADQRFRSAISGAAAKPRLKQTAYAPPITAMAGSVPPAPTAAPVQTAVPMAGGYVGAGSVQQPADNQKHGGFTAGLRRLALLGYALLFVWGGIRSPPRRAAWRRFFP